MKMSQRGNASNYQILSLSENKNFQVYFEGDIDYPYILDKAQGRLLEFSKGGGVVLLHYFIEIIGI